MDAELQHHDDEVHRRPLLWRRSTPDPERITLISKAISATFQSVAHLANLLPTGTIFAFQLLSPIFSNQGECDGASRSMTVGLVILCGLSCFVSCFTDSFRDEKGVVHYGIATLKGLWIIDGSITVPPQEASEYKLKFIDLVHAFMSTLVFAAVALFDQNVVNCFYPSPSEETTELLTAMPLGIGMIGSAFFLSFPTTRHGIGFPLSPR